MLHKSRCRYSHAPSNVFVAQKRILVQSRVIAQRPNPPVPVAPGPDPWKKVVEAQSSGATVSGKVQSVNKGGIVVILEDGLRAFVPMSQVSTERLKPELRGDLDFLIGQTVNAKVVSVDLQSARREIILSERRIQELDALRRLTPGDEVKGIVSNITDQGAFIKLDQFTAINGYVPKSHVSWTPLITIESALSVGQNVCAKVLEVDADRGRLSLSIKQTTVDPLKQTMDQLDWVNGSSTDPQILELSRQLRQQVGVDAVTLSRVAQAKQVATQGLEVYLVKGEECDISRFLSKEEVQAASQQGTNAKEARGQTCLYTIVARLGVEYQEMLVQTELTRREMKRLMQRAVSAVARTA